MSCRPCLLLQLEKSGTTITIRALPEMTMEMDELEVGQGGGGVMCTQTVVVTGLFGCGVWCRRASTHDAAGSDRCRSPVSCRQQLLRQFLWSHAHASTANFCQTPPLVPLLRPLFHPYSPPLMPRPLCGPWPTPYTPSLNLSPSRAGQAG
jgi:hypothetical protein